MAAGIPPACAAETAALTLQASSDSLTHCLYCKTITPAAASAPDVTVMLETRTDVAPSGDVARSS